MEALPKDLLLYIAMMLDYPDILKLCNSNSQINEKVCMNEIFWLNKIKKDYPQREKFKLYGSTYKQIYKNLKYPIIIDLTIRIDVGDMKIFSYPIVIDDNNVENIGKYIVYIISVFGDALWKDEKIILNISNESESKVCEVKPWEYDASCLEYINYDTKKIVADISIVRGYDIDYNIQKFYKIVKYVDQNINKNIEDWPPLWL